MLVIRKAKFQDMGMVRRMLREASMEEKGIEKHLDHFFIVEDPERSYLVGVVGMEIHNEVGLLRSFVIEKEVWSMKLIWRLFQVVFDHAQEMSLKEIYLIAGTTVEWFQLLGFSIVSPSELPESIQQSDHGRQALVNGTVMVYHEQTTKIH